MIKQNNASSKSQTANDLYEQLLQGGRARASHSVHNAKHRTNVRILTTLAVLLLAGAATMWLT